MSTRPTLSTLHDQIRRLTSRTRKPRYQETEASEQKAAPPQTQNNVALNGGTTYGVQDGTMHVYNTGAKTDYLQHIAPGAAAAQGPDSTAIVNNYAADGPAWWIREHKQSPPGIDELRRLRDRPSKLLATHRQVIEFTGREKLLDELREWRDDDTIPRAAWLLHAPGGQGKTRLADQFATDSAAAGWVACHARHRDEGTAPGAGWEPAAADRVLIIIDYAERWPRLDLLTLLRFHLERRVGQTRLLLLARSTEWWPAIDVELDKLAATRDPEFLSPLASDEATRERLLTAALRRYAEIFGINDFRAIPRPELPGDGLVLSLHMSALAAADAYHRAERPPSSPAGVSAYLLNRERDYWAKLSADRAVETLARTAFTAALTGAVTNHAGTALLDRVGLPAASGLTAQQLLDHHKRCYPPTDQGTVLEPLYPDLLAADFIALSLPGHAASGFTDTWAADLVTLSGPEGSPLPGTLFAPGKDIRPNMSRALIFLAAAGHRWPHVADALRTLLSAQPDLAIEGGGAALSAVVPHTDNPLAEEIFDRLPDSSVDLDPAAAELAQHLVNLAGPETSTADRAVRYLNLSQRLGNAGRLPEMLDSTQRAIALYGELAPEDRDAHLPDLAMSLNNHGLALAAVGRQAEALGYTGHALNVFGQMANAADNAGADSDIYLVGLAMSATNYAIGLTAAGRRAEATEYSEFAVNLYRELAREYPDAFLPQLARSMTHHVRALAMADRESEALDHSQHAVDLLDELAKANPDGCLPYLANALNDHVLALTAAGRQSEALEDSRRAVDLLGKLAETNPGAHLPGLARSEFHHALMLAAAGRNTDAIHFSRRAINTYGELATAAPVVFLPILVNALINHADLLVPTDGLADALAFSSDTVDLCLRLAKASPTTYAPGLCKMLVKNMKLLARAGKWTEIRDYGKRLSELSGAQAETGAGTRALIPVGGEGHLVLGSMPDTLADYQRAVELYTTLAESNPDAHLPELARTLRRQSVELAVADQWPEALDTSERAIRLYSALAEADSGTHLPDLALSVSDHAVWLASAGRHPDALACSQDAVGLCATLAEADPSAHLPLLALSASNHILPLAAAGRWDEALGCAQCAVELYGNLVETKPGMANQEHLKRTLRTFGFVRAVRDSDPSATDLYAKLEETERATFNQYLLDASRDLADAIAHPRGVEQLLRHLADQRALPGHDGPSPEDDGLPSDE